MERTSLSGLAPPHARRAPAGSLRWLRQGLESLSRQASTLWQAAAVGFIVFGAGWIFASQALERHANYQSNAYDLGFFDQIVWNTSQGRVFETSFVGYSFLGQHFEPILLLFAGLYAIGAGVESLLVIQAGSVAFAIVPLFLAARRLTRSPLLALACAVAFLLSPQLHAALNFDFHPEMMSFFFVFLSLYFIADEQAGKAAFAVMPLLLIKEDLVMVVLAMGVLMILRGQRRSGARLAILSLIWTAAIVFVVMPLLRHGNGSDLTARYAYLVEDTSLATFLPTVVERSVSHLWDNTAPAAVDLLLSGGIFAVLSPITVLLAMPNLLISGLADHPEQAGLAFHYSVPTLALTWVGILLGLEKLTKMQGASRLGRLVPVGSAALLVLMASVSFVTSSPYAARSEHRLTAEHRLALERGLSLIPPSASVEAQSSILPHLSQREAVFEFPDSRIGDYVIVDSGLPVSGQSRDAGFDAELAALPQQGYERIYEEGPVQVLRRTP